jgi:hypothetical protein
MLARRGRQLAVLTAAVVLAHLWLANDALPSRLGDGAADGKPARLAVVFVRQLAPSAAATAAPVPTRAVPRMAARAAAAKPAASAPAESPEPVAVTAHTEPMPVPEPPAVELAATSPTLSPTQAASAASAAEAAASAPSAIARAASPPVQAAASSAEAASEWPPSTRISYRLTGYYRGPIEGQASVEWLRSGSRYQVFMDLGIGPAFAPIMSRRVSSEGEITDKGLRPRRYDEETRVLLREPRRLVVQMDAERVRLSNGGDVLRPPGLQDSASQFVQLTWLFTTQPELLQRGRSIDMPLALPRSIEPWTYDVLEAETLATPAGPVPAVHVKPRREAKPGGDLTAEIWVAPSLQYLPVRILIRQDADTWIDMAISRLPDQAAPGR